MADGCRAAEQRMSRSTPLRAFGRALHWVGNGAKTVVATPFRVAGRRRERLAVQAGGGAAVLAEPSGPPPPVTPADMLRTFGVECRERMQQTQRELSTRLAGGAELLRRTLAPPQPAASFLAADCFPPRMVAGGAAGGAGVGRLAGGEEAQDLACTGSREMLRLRLYDFAVYLDRRQAQQSRLSRRASTQRRAGGGGGGEDPGLARGLRDSGDIEMCLVVRAARNLPIRLLAREYERILRRRLRAVGGSPDDPALAAMLAQLREERLPAAIKQRGSVRRGAVIAFARGRGGRLTAVAGGQDLGCVQSEPLARAVFDIYLGRQPVSVDGRRAAGESFLRMLREGDFAPPPAPLVCNASVCRVGRL